MEDKFTQEKLKEKEMGFIKENSENTEKEVYQCKICEKKFKAFNFIITHIKNKHSNELNEYANNKVNKYLMKENFYSDKEKFSRSNIIESKEYYEELLDKFNGKINYSNTNSTYDSYFYKKYKDWDDPVNFQSNKNPYKKIKYDDL